MILSLLRTKGGTTLPRRRSARAFSKLPSRQARVFWRTPVCLTASLIFYVRIGAPNSPKQVGLEVQVWACDARASIQLKKAASACTTANLLQG